MRLGEDQKLVNFTTTPHAEAEEESNEQTEPTEAPESAVEPTGQDQ